MRTGRHRASHRVRHRSWHRGWRRSWHRNQSISILVEAVASAGFSTRTSTSVSASTSTVTTAIAWLGLRVRFSLLAEGVAAPFSADASKRGCVRWPGRRWTGQGRHGEVWMEGRQTGENRRR